MKIRIENEDELYNQFDEFEKMFSRKTRTFAIKHLSQINELVEYNDIQNIRCYSMAIAEIIAERTLMSKEEPFSIAINNGGIEVKPIDYLAKLNPREKQNAKLPVSLENLVLTFLP